MPDLNSKLLKQAREESDLSQKELAENLKISQTQVSRYEKDPDSIPAGVLSRWLDMFGLGLEDLISVEDGKDLKANPGAPYEDLRKDLELIDRYVDVQATDSMESLSEGKAQISGDILSVSDLKTKIRHLYQKPNLTMAGGFDTGKSYLANTLMGKRILPTSFAPATRVVTVVRHVEDRPDFQDEDVWFFDEGVWKSDGQYQLDIATLDERSCEESQVLAGSHELLKRYGVHRNDEVTDKTRQKMEKAHTAVVYAESPILKACNIIDLPGFGDRPSGESVDQEKAESALPYADVVLYASRVKGHLGGKDLARLSSLLRQIPAHESKSREFPTLGGLFVVATHADRNVSDSDVEKIRDNRLSELHHHLKDGALSSYEDRAGRDVQIEDLENQWHPFWAENVSRSRPFIDRLEEILGKHLPNVKTNSARRKVEDLKEEATKRCEQSKILYREAAEESAEQKKRVEKLKKRSEEKRDKIAEKREDIAELIDDLEKKAKVHIRGTIRGYLDPNNDHYSIQDLIERNFDDKKGAKDRAPAMVVERIELEIEQKISNLNDTLVEEVNEYLELYEDLSIEVDGSQNGEVGVPFDAQGAFAGGLAGAAAAGGLAAWAAQVGPLGGYILAAQGYGALAALGLGVGGGAAGAMAWVAAMGGPVTLGTAIATIVGLGTWRLLSETWEQRLARKIASYLEDEGLKQDFLDMNEKYWNQTRDAFEKGANAVNEEFESYLEQLEELSADEKEARQLAEQFDEARDFFRGIPL